VKFLFHIVRFLQAFHRLCQKKKVVKFDHFAK
jgi:hypothetical protein